MRKLDQGRDDRIKAIIDSINENEKRMKMHRFAQSAEVLSLRYGELCTDFLDPYEMRLAESILYEYPTVSFRAVGREENWERQVLILGSEETEYSEPARYITALKISGDFPLMGHRDMLGSLMGMGIVRDKLGDIFERDGDWYVITTRTIGTFLLLEWDQAGHYRFKPEEVPLEEAVFPGEMGETVFGVVQSLRLDSLVAEGFHLARADAQKYCEQGLVRLNWELIKKTATTVNEGDWISVRGKGRIRLEEVQGTTKKGRTKVLLRILSNGKGR